jgi:hypothetical protein
MKGNGSTRGLWNCLLDRRHGDMETYGRPNAPIVAPGIRHWRLTETLPDQQWSR